MGKSVTTSAKNIYHSLHKFADGLSLSRSKLHPDSQRSYTHGKVALSTTVRAPVNVTTLPEIVAGPLTTE
jgi:hypothetical protein